MKFAKTALLGLAVILLMTAAAPLVSAEGSHVRWDIATVTCAAGGAFPCTLYPGRSATAMAVDCSIPGVPAGCSTITMTGSGTFDVSDDGESSRSVTGGGTWKVVAADKTITSGTFVVTELVQWEKSEPLAVP